MNPCSILDAYIKSRGLENVTYRECLYFLNNRTNLTQIQVFGCLNKYFPREKMTVCSDWIGIS